MKKTSHSFIKIVTLLLLFSITLSACAKSQPLQPTQATLPNTAETPQASSTPNPTPTPGIFSLPTPLVLGEYPLLSSEDIRFDLDELFRRLEYTHPNPYARRSKEEVDLERQRIQAELAQPMTMLDFYRKVTRLVSSLDDYHTYVSLPGEITQIIAESEWFFPFDLRTEGEHTFIETNFSGDDEFKPGSELLAVNGIPISLIVNEAKHYIPFGRIIYLPMLWYVLGSAQEYQVTLLLPGESTAITHSVPGLSSLEIVQNAPAYPPSDPVTYQKLSDEPIGVLTINHFVGIGRLLKASFAQMMEEGVQHLIIDVRANSGGQYDQVDALMDYLTDQSYKQCARSYKPPFGGYGSGAPRETVCELIQPFRVAERFEGKLYLLISADTVSAGVTFATILQDYRLATLIGEATLTPASYCADVPSELSVLPRTRLLYMCPRTCYVRPNGSLDSHGVIPDFIVKTSLEDRLAGNDPVLNDTLEMIRNKEQSP